MVNYFTAAYPPKPLPPIELAAAKKKALVEAVFAAIAGVIGGWYVAPAIVDALHVNDVQVISLIGLLTGLVFWVGLPWVIRKTLSWAQEKWGGSGEAK